MNSQAGGGLASYLPLIIIVAAFWLLILRPQQQRAKQQKQMMSELQVGDTVVSIGGIYGTIVELGDERLLIEVADGSRLQLARRAVGSVVPPDAEDETDDAAPRIAEESASEAGDDDTAGPDGDDTER